MNRFHSEISSQLRCPADAILRTLTIKGVNAELGPLVRMTAPQEWQDTPIGDWPVKQRLFDSWILLFGLLPVDRHHFYLDAVDPATGFSEASSSWVHRRWQHQRRVAPDGQCTRVTDTLAYECRLPLLGWILLPVYRAVFRIKHRHLRRTHVACG